MVEPAICAIAWSKSHVTRKKVSLFADLLSLQLEEGGADPVGHAQRSGLHQFFILSAMRRQFEMNQSSLFLLNRARRTLFADVLRASAKTLFLLNGRVSDLRNRVEQIARDQEERQHFC